MEKLKVNWLRVFMYLKDQGHLVGCPAMILRVVGGPDSERIGVVKGAWRNDGGSYIDLSPLVRFEVPSDERSFRWGCTHFNGNLILTDSEDKHQVLITCRVEELVEAIQAVATAA